MLTRCVTAVPAKELKRAVLLLDTRSDDITDALDLLLVGVNTPSAVIHRAGGTIIPVPVRLVATG